MVLVLVIKGNNLEEDGLVMVATPERMRQAAKRRRGAIGLSEKSLRMVVAGVDGGCGGGGVKESGRKFRERERRGG
uniref:Uncharacterized protein n=1 Tax=Medicago truncatula TaxID=3880 RepID=A2Q4T3_MEDTR|nr:hypothetical protein MtrDRAFT_AC157891g15v2 [Medicago truncatula]